ncbi:uncharacterized protein LOC144145912 [Haemaphysalis longicornis]
MPRPRIVRSDSEEREFKRQRLERERQRRKDPQVRARNAERMRLKRHADAELRAREAREKRARRNVYAARQRRDREAKRARRHSNPELRARAAGDRRQRRLQLAATGVFASPNKSSRATSLDARAVCTRVESSSAAECASSKTLASLVAGKCDSHAQCVVPLMFKSSQATSRTTFKSVEVQTMALTKILAVPQVASASAADCGSSKTRTSHLAGKCDSQTQCVLPLMFKCAQANLRINSRSVEVQTLRTGQKGCRLFGGHHFEVP